MTGRVSRRDLFTSLTKYGLGAVAASGLRIPEVLAHNGGGHAVSRTDSVTTLSTSFVDIPGMSIPEEFQRPNSLLVVLFSAEVLTSMSPDGRMDIRALDGPTVLEPPTANIITREGDIQAHGFNFYRLDAPVGNRIIRMQWRLSSSAGFARMDNRSMIVLLTAVP